MTKDAKIDLRLPSDMKAAVTNLAAVRGETRSRIVIEALKQYLSKKREQK